MAFTLDNLIGPVLTLPLSARPSEPSGTNGRVPILLPPLYSLSLSA